ncbi:MAG: hypothetical protein GXO58_04800 [Thermodesulfobacteria bacterium]|nr:hypothetical protein [Thermodesulfobacteriota bacterium]
MLLPVSALAGEEATPFGLVYIGSNTGGASGGHCALRLGDVAFHFQVGEQGFLKLVRQPWQEFLHCYNDIENRPIYLAKTRLPSGQVARIETHFLKLLLAQNRNFENLSALENEVRLLEGIEQGSDLALPVHRLGLFAWEAEPHECDETLLRLKKRVLDALGKDFLQHIKTKALLALQDVDSRAETLEIPRSKTQLVPSLGVFFKRLQESLSLWAMVRVLDLSIPLRDEVLVDGGEILPSFRASLEGFARELENSILALLSSKRPDKAEALLLQMARLSAIRKGLSSGRLLMLDTFPQGCQSVSYPKYRDDIEALNNLLKLLGKRLNEAQRRYSHHKSIHEPEFNYLENLATRFWELKQALSKKGPVRIWNGNTLPDRTLAVSLLSVGISVKGRPLGVKEARDGLKRYERSIKRLYGYDILNKNCVTELFSALESCLGPGRFPKSTTVGIPFLGFKKWISQMDVSKVEFYPSYRLRRLDEMYRGQNPLVVYLREFNTITSSIYHRNTVDTSFLLFSDDVLIPRPIYGCINVIYAGLNMAIGVLEAPFDKGARFSQGGWGLVYSIPELFMVNIRKGTFAWVPPN